MIQAGNNIVADDFINESEIPSPQSDAEGKVVKLESDGKISNDFIRYEELNLKEYPIVENMDGSTTPLAVFINSQGHIQKSKADVTGLEKFIGFCTDNIDDSEIEYLTAVSGLSATQSITAPAGENRVLLVKTRISKVSGLVDLTDVTFDGVSMTLVKKETTGDIIQSVYSIAIGTNSSNDSAKNIIAVGGTYSKLIVQGIVYANVNQTTPTGQATSYTSGSTTTIQLAIDPTNQFSKIVSFYSSILPITSVNNGQTQRIAQGNTDYIYDVNNKGGLGTTYSATVGSSVGDAQETLVELVAQPKTNSYIQFKEKITFSGLTPNAKYYLSNTAGAISTAPGSTSVLIGKALSETELLIIQD